MSKPFQGLTFCCTGIQSSQRHEVADKIVALGGTHYTDLMSSVTYLVVGSRNTEKYRYSVRYRHDVTFLSVSTILDAHARWTAGDDVSAALLRVQLPLFSSFVVCVARVDRPSSEEVSRLFGERFRTPPRDAIPPHALKDAFSAQDIVSVLAHHGAKVSSTLTPACNVIVGTDAAGRRFTMAQQWGIPAVHPLWIYDSCLRGAALDLDDYRVSTSGTNLYNNASFVWKKLYALRVQRAAQTAPDDEPQRIDKTALKKSSHIWSSIMDRTRSHTARLVRDSTWDDASEDEEETPVLLNSSKTKAGTSSSATIKEAATSTLFLGLKFLAVGFSIPQQKVLQRVVDSHQGEIAEGADDETITHILLLVRNGPQANLMLSMLPSAMKRRINSKEVAVVTDWFIERSIFYNRICLDSWCKPLQGLVPSATRYKVCISGFTGVELLHIEKLIGYLNLEFCDVLNANRDLLIININLFKPAFIKNSPKLFEYKHKDILHCPVYQNGDDSKSVSMISAKNKISAAKKWGIPIVSVAYLWEMIERSTNKANLQVPDILDLSWCIFAPQTMARPTTLLDYVRKMSNNFSTQTPSEGTEDVQVQLPSPRKAKNKLKYGRLAGGGESLTEKLKNAREDNEDTLQKGPDDTHDSDDMPTQVGYENQDSLHDKQELMRKLEGPERATKRRRKVT
ncbi:putative protein kinase activating protein [Clavispora lusitaniae]|uniref:BRCT domain-containing protein n=1 Tax=Clavispora lusitaniae TaxID=36911 RepID=A0AA91Q0C5_CLALS|nr:putative protein kinase activating protein [Clavispora lusitaniae]